MPSEILEAAWPAIRFDGRSTQRQPVSVRVAGDRLAVDDGAGAPATWPLSSIVWSEPWQDTLHPIGLPDGSTLWMTEDASRLWAALAAQGIRPGPVARATASWRQVVVFLVTLVLAIAWFDFKGIGLLGEAALGLMPRSLDVEVGRQAWRTIETAWLAPSRLPEARRAAVTSRFARLAESAAPELIFRLEFRRLKAEAGFNAFALPDGTIVLLDGLVESLDDDELSAVLGHELGHVVHRHGLRLAVRSLGAAAVASAAFGDFSGVAAGSVAAVQSLAYSRDHEREADAYARRLMDSAAIPSAAWRSLWAKFAAEQRRTGADAIPGWLATHPASEERAFAPNYRNKDPE